MAWVAAMVSRKVFISHASPDFKLAIRVAKSLREAVFQVWDETQILPGDNWRIQIAEALQEAEAMVVLLTPNALASNDLSHDVSYALGDEGYKGRVIPVLAAPPDQLPKEGIPWVLHKFPMIHLHNQEQDEEGLRSIAEAIEAAA
jgi:hypothetical protein